MAKLKIWSELMRRSDGTTAARLLLYEGHLMPADDGRVDALGHLYARVDAKFWMPGLDVALDEELQRYLRDLHAVEKNAIDVYVSRSMNPLLALFATCTWCTPANSASSGFMERLP